MSVPQRTLAGPVSIQGRGLFSGESVTLTLAPAPADHGIVLVRSDLEPNPGAWIPAIARNVVHRRRRTALRSGPAAVETCEHLLSALAAMGVDNVRAEVSAQEMPMGDGSALPFVDAIEAAGLAELQASRQAPFVLDRVVRLGDASAWIEASPSDDGTLTVSYSLDYGPGAPLNPQAFTYAVAEDSYSTEVAPARTFVVDGELEVLQAAGLCRHLSPAELMVVGNAGPRGGMAYRFVAEPARHKVLDIIGDLALLGAPMIVNVHGYRSGHALNQALVRRLAALASGDG